MPALTALAAEAGVAAQPASPSPSVGVLAIAGGAGLLGAAALAGRRRFRLAALAAAIGLALGAFAATTAAGRASASPVVAVAAPAPAEMGKILFVAKGCVQCHANNRIEPGLRPFSTEMGPNLSNYQASPEFMHLWLKDPKTAKPQTQMPNLQLTSAEIDALMAFLAQQ
jgi:mono/diheme cytochrome c family protein